MNKCYLKANVSYLIAILVISVIIHLMLLSIYHQKFNHFYKIVAIDIEQVIKAQKQWLMRSDLNTEEQLALATYLNEHLNQLLATTAREQQLIFLTPSSVLAGSPDNTNDLLDHQRQQFEQLQRVLHENATLD